MSRRRHSSISSRNGDWGGGAGLRCVVGHGWRTIAKVRDRLGATDRTAVGGVAVGPVGGHGDGRLSRMIGAAGGGAASSDGRKSWGYGWLAVHRRRRSGLCILCGRTRRADHDGRLRTCGDYRRLSWLLRRTGSGGIRSSRVRSGVGRRNGVLLIRRRSHKGGA